MKRQHSMPFGAEPLAGGVRLRLWAPAAQQVDAQVDGVALPLNQSSDGWWSTVAPAAGPGSRYAYRIDGQLQVPDPASRFNPQDIHAPSEVIQAGAFAWEDSAWRGRPWEEAVIYELHVGTFTPEGTFAAAEARLEYLLELGITAVELMPPADFSGRRNWGYDGVLLFAPDSRYGRPEDFKRLVARAHALGLMVLLDVVYNHFGPEGNYLGSYAPGFFNPAHVTPWGAAINYDGSNSRTVRDFFIHNALYWLEEYGLDGLRLDAVHAIEDSSEPHFIEELGAAVQAGPGRHRHVHLVLENDRNEARHLTRDGRGAVLDATAQWNDDFHHAMHVLLTGESDGYYADYVDHPIQHAGRCLAEGFAYQGQSSGFHGGEQRGHPSAHLPPMAFVNFLQNHDQVGNRAFGERLCHLVKPHALAAAVDVLLLAPSPPLLFMGEEFGAAQPFLYFCDFPGELGAAVTRGRRAEFARFKRFADPEVRNRIPDPNAEATFAQSKLDWGSAEQPAHQRWLNHYRNMLALRHMWIVPRLAGTSGHCGQFDVLGRTTLRSRWSLGDGSSLTLLANLGAEPASAREALASGEPFYLSDNLTHSDLHHGRLPAWSVAWFMDGERPSEP